MNIGLVGALIRPTKFEEVGVTTGTCGFSERIE